MVCIGRGEAMEWSHPSRESQEEESVNQFSQHVCPVRGGYTALMHTYMYMYIGKGQYMWGALNRQSTCIWYGVHQLRWGGWVYMYMYGEHWEWQIYMYCVYIRLQY